MIGLEYIAFRHNIKRKEIAEHIKVKPQTVSDWLMGKRKIPSERALQLSELFGVKVELLYMDEEDLSELDRASINYAYQLKKDSGDNETINRHIELVTRKAMLIEVENWLLSGGNVKELSFFLKLKK